MPGRQRHEPGTRVERAGEYVPVDEDGDRTAGPIPLEAGDEFPPLNGADEAWMPVDDGGG
jgi:hypothetical protein